MVTVDLALTVDKMMKLIDSCPVKKLIICPFAAGLPFPKNLLFPLVKRRDVAKLPKHPKVETWKDVLKDATRPAPVQIDPEKDIAVLQYTGGTTGIPKGAALTHANVYANVRQALYWMAGAKAGEDSMLGVLPFFHVFAMTVVMNWTLANGMKIIMQPKFDLNEVLKIIDKDRPSFFPAVPAIFNAIANHADVAKYDFSCLKFCISGGAPLPADVKRLFEEKTGSHTIAEGYGLTEASPIVTCNPLGRNKVGSIGLPLPQTIVEIISRDDNKTVMPTGELGEVCVRGPQVMQGYYNKPEETDNVLKGGRLHTGDVGYIDDEGYVYIVDRIKDLIIVRGYNVYPRVVEEALYLHPAVDECIVAGVPDAERGETVHAWVKPAAGQKVTEQELLDFVKDKLNPIEVPRKIIVRNEPLPKTTVGKLSRKDLLIQEGIKR
jgi:long-chain acyl-CoA synthetase